MKKCNYYRTSVRFEEGLAHTYAEYYGVCCKDEGHSECFCDGNSAKCDAGIKIRKHRKKKSESCVNPVGRGYLSDWYINSVNETDTPIWTEEHLDELFNDFYLIPKEKK